MGDFREHIPPPGLRARNMGQRNYKVDLRTSFKECKGLGSRPKGPRNAESETRTGKRVPEPLEAEIGGLSGPPRPRLPEPRVDPSPYIREYTHVSLLFLPIFLEKDHEDQKDQRRGTGPAE